MIIALLLIGAIVGLYFIGRKWEIRWYWLASIFAAFFGLLWLIFFFVQPSILYFPTVGEPSMPGSLTLIVVQEAFKITAADGDELSVWHLKPRVGGNGQVIINCHGNGGNLVADRAVFEVALNAGYSVVTFDYRGYGASGLIKKTQPSETRMYEDIQTVHKWVLDKNMYAGNRIVIRGHSLGAAVAIAHGAKNGRCYADASKPASSTVDGDCLPYSALLIDSPFYSLIHEVRDSQMIMYTPLITWMFLSYSYNSAARMREMNPQVPIFFLHGTNDRNIPARHSQWLFDIAKERSFVNALREELPGIDHYRATALAFPRVSSWIRNLLKV